MGMWDIPKDPANDGRFTEEEIKAFLQDLARAVVRRRMTVPAVMALEMSKPVTFLGYSSMVAFGPILEMLFDPQKVEKLTCILADRSRIEELLTAIETLEKEGPDKEGDSGGH